MNEPIEESIYRYLDTNGDGTGTTSATGNYAATAESFFIQPEVNKSIKIERMLVYLEDSGTFDSGDYGNGLALTNGISVQVLNQNDELITDLTAGLPIKQNGHWARLCYDADHQNYGVGNEYMSVRWTFAKSGFPVRLINRQKLAVIVNDDMTGLVDHTFHVQGSYF